MAPTWLAAVDDAYKGSPNSVLVREGGGEARGSTWRGRIGLGRLPASAAVAEQSIVEHTTQFAGGQVQCSFFVFHVNVRSGGQ